MLTTQCVCLDSEKYSNETSVKVFRETSIMWTHHTGRRVRNRNATGSICVDMVCEKKLISEEMSASYDKEIRSKDSVILDGVRRFCCIWNVFQMQRFEHGSAKARISRKILDMLFQAAPFPGKSNRVTVFRSYTADSCLWRLLKRESVVITYREIVKILHVHCTVYVMTPFECCSKSVTKCVISICLWYSACLVKVIKLFSIWYVDIFLI